MKPSVLVSSLEKIDSLNVGENISIYPSNNILYYAV